MDTNNGNGRVVSKEKFAAVIGKGGPLGDVRGNAYSTEHFSAMQFPMADGRLGAQAIYWRGGYPPIYWVARCYCDDSDATNDNQEG